MTNDLTKLTYETPELAEWGDIEDLTLGEQGFPGDNESTGTFT